MKGKYQLTVVARIKKTSGKITLKTGQHENKKIRKAQNL
jgi:hypothetical protein